jgi:hypothetical protein
MTPTARGRTHILGGDRCGRRGRCGAVLGCGRSGRCDWCERRLLICRERKPHGERQRKHCPRHEEPSSPNHERREYQAKNKKGTNGPLLLNPVRDPPSRTGHEPCLVSHSSKPWCDGRGTCARCGAGAIGASSDLSHRTHAPFAPSHRTEPSAPDAPKHPAETTPVGCPRGEQALCPVWLGSRGTSKS